MTVKKLNISEIRTYLPHSYPFLLVDRIEDYEIGKSIIGIKNVTYNEEFFCGHFQMQPIMPGVLLLEALAQTAGILYFLTTNTKASPENWFYFAGIDNARFKKVVIPGDQLKLHVKMVGNKFGKIWFFDAEAKVDGEIVCSVELKIAKGALKND
jgi:3-hydroxyacyl-[acyl-carrier-protein] dehydratase